MPTTFNAGRSRRGLATLLTLSVAALCRAQERSTPCSDLAQQLNLNDVEIKQAIDVAAGPFAPEGDKTLNADLPAFCRVVAVAHPTPASDIHFEVWLPASKAWNHRLEGIGSRGTLGSVDYQPMADALRQGYAVTATDSGHTGANRGYANGHPERVVDWAYRGVHVTAQAAKRITGTYFGHGVEHAYFNGCGYGGGTQALSEAERFPQDYDGILAGDAPPDRVRLDAAAVWNFKVAHDGAGNALLTDDALHTLHAAAIAACDAKDGLKDGIIGEPQACRFDPKVTLCKGGASAGCLTQPQVDAARALYAGPKMPGTKEKEPLVSGYAPGSELGWGVLLNAPQPVSTDVWRLWVEGRPAWDWHSFDLAREVSLGEEKLGILNASEVELGNFKQRGGKLIVYHGWADGVIPAGEAVEFFSAVAHENEDTPSFARLFLAPGMGYCGGGEGFQLTGGIDVERDRLAVAAGSRDAAHDMMAALDQWVSKGEAPEIIIARRPTATGDQGRLLPVCACPGAPHWDGKGDRNDVDSYLCRPMK